MECTCPDRPGDSADLADGPSLQQPHQQSHATSSDPQQKQLSNLATQLSDPEQQQEHQKQSVPLPEAEIRQSPDTEASPQIDGDPQGHQEQPALSDQDQTQHNTPPPPGQEAEEAGTDCSQHSPPPAADTQDLQQNCVRQGHPQQDPQEQTLDAVQTAILQHPEPPNQPQRLQEEAPPATPEESLEEGEGHEMQTSQQSPGPPKAQNLQNFQPRPQQILHPLPRDPQAAPAEATPARRGFGAPEAGVDRLSSIDEQSVSWDAEDERASVEEVAPGAERDVEGRASSLSLQNVNDKEMFKEFSYPGSPEYVGFGNLTAQIQRIWRRKGFDFTLMVVGESGLGKSTLLENLFSTPIPRTSDANEEHECDAPDHTTVISSRSALISEGGLSLRLSLVDTPGFGAGLNSVGDAEPIANYLQGQLERYFVAESDLNRRDLHDCLIHCCFFFLNPSTRGLKPLEIQCLKRLHHLVNVIPIIGKADTLTQQELMTCKQKILQDLHSHGIRTYLIPDYPKGEDEGFRKQMEQIRKSMPFAVIGGNSYMEVSPGHRIRVRSYPWGTVDVENSEFSDFVKLRALVITHLEDMREKTHDIIYETYRAERLKNGHNSQRRVDEAFKSIEEKEKFLSRKEEELRRREREVRRLEEVMEVMYGENILKVNVIENPEKMKRQIRHSQFERK